MTEENIKAVKAIVEKNGWAKYHNNKDLLLSISIELGELQEIFQWHSDDQITEADIELARMEMADILIYMQHLANRLNIDLEQAVADKMAINMTRTWNNPRT